LDGAKVVAERIRKRVKPDQFTQHQIKLTLSFGVAVYNQVMPLDMIMKMADDSLKMAKASGKDQAIFSNNILSSQ